MYSQLFRIKPHPSIQQTPEPLPLMGVATRKAIDTVLQTQHLMTPNIQLELPETISLKGDFLSPYTLSYLDLARNVSVNNRYTATSPMTFHTSGDGAKFCNSCQALNLIAC